MTIQLRFFFNRTYIGANHGASIVQELTVANHDKTDVDVGSRWLDANSRQWYLIKVVSAMKLWVISDDATGNWSFQISIPPGPLTHSWGAAHSSDIAYTNAVLTQTWPATETVAKTVRLNDGALTNGGVYTAKSVDIHHRYFIKDMTSMLWFMTNNVGTEPARRINDPAIMNIAEVDVTYSFNSSGACTVFQKIQFLKGAVLNLFSGVQQGVMRYGTGRLFEYVPGSIEFGMPVDITVPPTNTILMPAAKWRDTNNPPNRFIQYVTDNSGKKICGYVLGYSLDFGETLLATRSSIANAFMINASRKQYPYAINYSAARRVDENQVFDVVAYRVPINYASNPEPLCSAWYSVKGTNYVVLEFAGAFRGLCRFPDDLHGQGFTVVDQQGPLAFEYPYFTSQGVLVETTGPASAILRLTPVELPKIDDCRLRTAEGGASEFGFNVIGSTNMPVMVEGSTNLDAGSWVLLKSNTISGDPVYFGDLEWTNFPQRFYRVRLP